MKNYSNISPNVIRRHFENLHWNLIEHPNKNIFLFQSPKELNKDIQLLFPKSNEFGDWDDKIQSLFKALSVIYKKSIDEVAKELTESNKDIFKAIINKGKKMNFINLSLAKTTIGNLYNLFLYAYSYEFMPVAHFLEAHKKAKEKASNLIFPHTINSSFGLSVEMEIDGNYLFQPDEEPYERKIIKRIFTGFQDLDLAIKERNENFIVNNFTNGFNANMCDALVRMSKGLERNTITFDVSLSPNYKSKNLEGIKPFILRNESSEILESASFSLKEKYPAKDIEISGYVIILEDRNKDQNLRLSSDSNPRRVTISWKDKTRIKLVKVVLNEKDYQEAIKDHDRGNLIRIVGDLTQKRNELELINYKNYSKIS